ncbi:hypothetical protein DMB92_01575 [Campylobacter sp. MIT 99-7217]|uniref:uracil-DNA glycosylase family protein n=1 Tax=Campylobacter sp. MIT 99-7217 TaxID=535091 RepID=UPI001159E9B3|nr:uracil-DNA glycosylase family protein [Campylobacter sp. MIT 99-7217]TQR34676.1 hypothetical protein DMB92_01575 [Campylobacter sp. MIT 99-7217]
MSKIRGLYYLKAFGYEFIDSHLSFQNEDLDFYQLKAQIANCSLCTLSKKRKCSVLDKMKKPCKLMIVDSFISKSENDSGVILNSNKGLNLKTMLKESLFLHEEEYYMSYVLKCFSANKNDDFALKQCLPYWFNEFYLLCPKVVLILGQNSFECLGFKDFSLLRGELFSYKNSWIMSTFDLDFIAKNPSFKQDFLADLQKIKGLL